MPGKTVDYPRYPSEIQAKQQADDPKSWTFISGPGRCNSRSQAGRSEGVERVDVESEVL
jgi:hypothetical protein